MASSYSFIRTRTVATRNVQSQITATWQWSVMSVADWDADLAAYDIEAEDVSTKEAAAEVQRGICNSPPRRAPARLPGLHEFKAVGKNASGSGPESPVASFTLP
jgi:hypothetical protein